MQDDPAADPSTTPATDGDDPIDPPTSEIPAATAVAGALATDSPVCPFLRSIGADDSLLDPIGTPDPANRCAALRQAIPQSTRQQELVCLTSAHVNCPRYLRGAPAPTLAPSAIVATRLPAPDPKPVEAPATSALTPATAVALLVFAIAFLLSLAFVVSNGGLEIAGTEPSPGASSPALGVAPSPIPTATGPVASRPTGSSVIVVAPPASGPAASATPGPDPSAAASPVAPSPSAVAPTPAPSSDRFAILKACPGKADCWIYTIRSGDNLFSIAHYFGVPLATVERLNPWTKTSGLKSGQQLRLPTPTR